MIRNLQTYSFILLLLFSSACANKEKPQTLTVFAASGARAISEELCDRYELKYHCKVQRNYASTGVLARQVLNGASCDVFISANKEWVDYLIQKKQVNPNEVSILAHNSLVFISPKPTYPISISYEEGTRLTDIVQDKMAIGDPAFVPVGKYAKEMMDSLGWYEDVQSKLILAKNVSSVLHFVELGECELGIVYKTEALLSNKVKIVSEVPQYLHQPIAFLVANVSPQNKLSSELYRFFTSEEAKRVLKKAGFKNR